MDVFLLSVVLILALLFRLYNLNTPLADWHSHRQADTAAVARNFIERGFSVTKPVYDDVSNIQTGQYNPEGLRLVEFPLYNSTFALLRMYLPVLTLEAYGRLVTAVFSLMIIAVVYYFLKAELGHVEALTGAGLYAFFPFFVFYSRVILPETMAIAFAMLAAFFLYLWKRSDTPVRKGIYVALSVITGSLGLLVKPTVAFYLLVPAYIFFSTYRFRMIRRPLPYIYLALVLVPLIVWRYWVSMFPVGVPAYEWLITTVQTFEGPRAIFMRPAFFRWIFHERILILILGGWAGAFVIFGLVRKTASMKLIHAFGLSALIYLLVFQGGNVQHDYYQTIILPALAIYVGSGIGLLYKLKKVIHPLPLTAVVAAAIVFSWFISYTQIKPYYAYSEDLISTARIIRTITPDDALIVTDTIGDTTLLYNADRKGFPAVTAPLSELKSQHGAEYFVTMNGEVADQVDADPENEFEIIFRNDNVTIFRL